MPTLDPLRAVARDLAVLSASDRRAILAALGDEERERLRAAMRGNLPPAIASRREEQARHSPWVADLLAAAERGDDTRMTPAARSALLEAVQQTRGVAAPAASRSLLQAASGLLGQGIPR